MKARPLVYVSDLDESVEFYSLLGLVIVSGRKRNIVELRGEDITIALHRSRDLPATTPKPRVLLTFEADRPIRELAESLQHAGVDLERDVTDEAYGYSIALRDPDGLLIQINQHELP